jgi:hypothetical protein
MLEKAFAAYQEALPGRARTVRMGWSYHNNRTFAALDKLGVEVDTSGIPGLRIIPPKKTGASLQLLRLVYHTQQTVLSFDG